MDDNTLISFGGSIKAIAETADSFEFEGPLVVFDSHDISPLRDKFLKSTDYDIEDGDKTTIYYNHGLDPTLKADKLGSGQLFIKDSHVWLKGEIKKRSDYLAAHRERIIDGIKQGLFGLSSGVPSHLVERKAIDGGHEVLKWPLGKDASITPIPAEPLTYCCSLKSLMDTSLMDTSLEWEGKRFDPSQPRDQQGKWTVIAGKRASITGKSVGQADIQAAADKYGVSASGRQALLDAGAQGTIKTDDHLLRAIAHAQDSRGTHYGNYAAAAAVHGVGGTHEGRHHRKDFATGGESQASASTSKPVHQMSSYAEVTAYLEANPHLIKKRADDRYFTHEYIGESGATAKLKLDDGRDPEFQAATVLRAEKQYAADQEKAAEMGQRINAMVAGKEAMTADDHAALASFRKLKSSEKYAVEQVLNGRAEATTPAQQRMADAAQKWHQGTPYAPPTTGKEPHFKKDDPAWMPVTEQGFITDTHLLIKGDAPKGVRVHDEADFQPPRSEGLWPSGDGKQIKPVLVKPEGYDAADAATASTVRVYMNDGTAVDKRYLDLVKARFPDATFHGYGALNAIVIKNKGERIGILMPMQAGSNDFKSVAGQSLSEHFDPQLRFYLIKNYEPENYEIEETDFNFSFLDTIPALKSGRVDLRLSDHPTLALAAVEGLLTRLKEFDALKAGRVMSADTHSSLKDCHARLESAVGDLKELLSKHDPQQYAESYDADADAEKSLTLDAEIEALEIRFLELVTP